MFNPTNFATQIVFCLYWIYHAREERKRERQRGGRERERVVSIGRCPAFYVILVPLEYIPIRNNEA